MAEIELGINTFFALGRYPEAEEWLHVVKDLLGITHVQFCFDMLDPIIVEREVLERKCREIREAATSKGVSIDTAVTGEIPHKSNCLLDPDPTVRRCHMRWFEGLIRSASLLGAKASGVYLGTLSQRDHEDDARRAYLVSVLLEEIASLTDVARQEGHECFLWEPMSIPRELPCTIAETRELLDRVNAISHLPVRLCLDVGHGWFHSPEAADHDPYAWLQELGHAAPVVHMQQTDGKGSRHWPFTEEFNALGVISAERVIETLERSGVDKVQIVFEFFYSAHALADESVLENLKRSAEYWQEALARR